MQKDFKVLIAGLVAVVFLTLFGSMTMQSEAKQLAGGWGTISVSDERVMESAKFAVTTQSALSKTQLKLVSVAEASTQVVAGTNHSMALKVLQDGVARKIHAIVWVKLDGSRELIQWSWH